MKCMGCMGLSSRHDCASERLSLNLPFANLFLLVTVAFVPELSFPTIKRLLDPMTIHDADTIFRIPHNKQMISNLCQTKHV